MATITIDSKALKIALKDRLLATIGHDDFFIEASNGYCKFHRDIEHIMCHVSEEGFLPSFPKMVLVQLGVFASRIPQQPITLSFSDQQITIHQAVIASLGSSTAR